MNIRFQEENRNGLSRAAPSGPWAALPEAPVFVLIDR